MIRLGKKGYRCIMSNLTRTSDYLAACLEQLGFILMSKTGGKGLPLVAFRLDPAKGHHYDEFAVAHQLRERGWVVPAYTMAPHSEKLKLMRVVVREDFSRSRCDTLIKDIKLAVETLNKMDKEKVENHIEYVYHLLTSHPTTSIPLLTVAGKNRHVKKHTKHGKKRGGNQTKHFENEKHSLQGKSGKVSLAPLFKVCTIIRS